MERSARHANGGGHSGKGNSDVAKYRGACPASRSDSELLELVKKMGGDEAKIQSALDDWWQNMATPAPQYNDVVPLTAADKRLEASLNRIKFASSDVLDAPSPSTEASFSSASAEHVHALEGAGLKKQAGEMRKVDLDYRNATTSSKKQRIVQFLAKSLCKMTRKKLIEWSMAGAVTSAGVVYALYEITTDGRLIEVSDVNLDGWTDEHRIDVDYDGVADYTLLDRDFDGVIDTLVDAKNTVLIEGLDDGIMGGLIEFFSNLF